MTGNLWAAGAADVFQHLGLWIFKLLAVVGGAGLGALLTDWLVRGLCRGVARRKAPPLLLHLRWLGALAGALLVWIWAFGPGGGGFGGPGGFGLGLGDGNGGPPEPEPRDRPAAVGTAPEKTSPTLLQIAIARSKEYERGSRRYYLVEGRPTPLALDELMEVVAKRREEDPSAKTLEVVVYQDSIAEAHGYVDALRRRAGPLGLEVTTKRRATETP